MRAPLEAFYDYHPKTGNFLDDVVAGLSADQKSLPCKYFYDEAGSRLFEEICTLEEYYPTRTEMGLLADNADDIAARMGADCHLVEFGSGSSTKVRILLDHLENPRAYVSVDISREHLLASTGALAADYRHVEMVAICADYTTPFELPPLDDHAIVRPMGFFPGSTIGNFTPDEAEGFLANAARILVGGGMVIGVDLKKDPRVLTAAYNDVRGVTAAFNLNILARINEELDGDFRLHDFEHVALYNEAEGRIEMHLVSRRDQTARVDGHRFEFAEGETIHTENSYKYGIDEFRDLARRANFEPVDLWVDDEALFSIHYLAAP